MKTYTVLVIRAEHIASDFGKDTFLAHVEATSVDMAEHHACWEAAKADFVEDDYSFEEMVKQGTLSIGDDYAVLLVIEGKHMDIKTS
ncbi:MAG: hypothetical protein HQ445_08100 [Polaromonas sp.]|nr:hypothetical protein [Polaromonas sp.]